MHMVLCTVPDETLAASVARTLVDEGLAACVNRLPVGSTYRWQGRICEESEVLLLIKTRSDGYAALESRLVELHPYAVPEVIAFEASAAIKAYLD